MWWHRQRQIQVFKREAVCRNTDHHHCRGGSIPYSSLLPHQGRQIMLQKQQMGTPFQMPRLKQVKIPPSPVLCAQWHIPPFPSHSSLPRLATSTVPGWPGNGESPRDLSVYTSGPSCCCCCCCSWPTQPGLWGDCAGNQTWSETVTMAGVVAAGRLLLPTPGLVGSTHGGLGGKNITAFFQSLISQ